MLILLPPSEGKAAPRRGARLDPDSWPSGLAEPRREVLDALVALCSGDLGRAVTTLGLGPSQAEEVTRNSLLATAPTRRADEVYSGVLYEALSAPTLTPAARRRAATRVAITSSAFGLVRPTERIPAYRLSGDVTLPGVGKVSAFWRRRLDPVVAEYAGRGLVVDLRSTTYAAFWRPPSSARLATVRVLHRQNGELTVVSHFNKATKGRLVRNLLEDGAAPRRPAELADVLTGLGWTVRVDGPRLDVVVGDL